ncbi:MAG: hypothetical protein IT379_15780 [Deltaproteobacteria bacterium]|nr:hypothetical protein [Deltaproteobacteria bacterium]
MSNEALKRRLQRALDSVGDLEPHPNAMETRLPKIANDAELKNALAKHADVALWIREIELVDRALRVWPEPTIDDDAFDAMAARIEQRLDEDLPALQDDPTEAPRFEDPDAGKTYDEVKGGLAGLTAAAKAAGPPPPPAPSLAEPARKVHAPPPPPPPAAGTTRRRGDATLKGIAPPPPPSSARPPGSKTPKAVASAPPTSREAEPIERLSLTSMEEVRDSAERVSLSDVGVGVEARDDEAGVVAIGTQVPASEPPGGDATSREVGERISFSRALQPPKLAALDAKLEPPVADIRPASEIPAALKKAAAEARGERRSDRPAPVISLDAARDRAPAAAPKEGRSMFWPTVAGVCALAAAAVIAITVQQRSAAPGSMAQLDQSERSAAEPAATVAPAAPALEVPPPPPADSPAMIPTGAAAAVGPESPATEAEGAAVGPESAFNTGAMPAPAAPAATATTTVAPAQRGLGAVGGAAPGGSPREAAPIVAAADALGETDDGATRGRARDERAEGDAEERRDRERVALRAQTERPARGGAGGGGVVTEAAVAPTRSTGRPAATPPPTAAPTAPAPSPPPARQPAREPEAPVDPSTLPVTLDRAAVVRGFAGVAAEVRGCATDGRHGVAQVEVTIANTGRVVGAVVSGGQFAGTPIGSCVARAVRRARFPRFQQPTVRVSYPFNL